MIDLNTEHPITLEQARHHRLLRNLGRNGTPDFSTIWRWCKVGINKVKLDYLNVPRGICTTEESIIRFIEALTAGEGGAADRNPAEAQKSAAKAQQFLAASGI